MKRCSKCGRSKSLSDFHKDSTRKDGLAVWCKACVKRNTDSYYQKNKKEIREKSRIYRQQMDPVRLAEINSEYGRRWRSRNPDHARLITLRQYGLTPESYAELLRSQGGGCAICGSTEKRLHIDHDHRSGQRRGVLCQSCNHGLGNFLESPRLMRVAMRYLAGWLKKTT